MNESTILARMRLFASRLGLVTFRNNVGQAWQGRSVVKRNDGSLIILDPRPVQYGLIKGSSDLIGWLSHIVRPDDVGRRVAIFTAIETKSSTGRPTPGQINFINQVRGAGGIALVAKSDTDLSEAIDEWKSVSLSAINAAAKPKSPR